MTDRSQRDHSPRRRSRSKAGRGPLPFVLLVLLAGCAGCSEAPGHGTDPTSEAGGVEPTLEVRVGYYRDGRPPLVILEPAAKAELSLAAQGGQVMYVGAEVTGLLADRAEVRARLVHPRSEILVAQDKRALYFLPETDGHRLPDPESRSHVLHLLPCPNDSPEPILGQPWRLEISVQADGERGSQMLEVNPDCSHFEASLRELCECECAANYQPGRCNGLQ